MKQLSERHSLVTKQNFTTVRDTMKAYVELRNVVGKKLTITTATDTHLPRISHYKMLQNYNTHY